MLHSRIVAEYQRLQQERERLVAEIGRMPPGHLICSRGKRGNKWYHTIDGKRIYIKKKDRAFAEVLAVKKYLSLLLRRVEQQHCALGFYLRHYKEDTMEAAHLLEEVSAYQELLKPFFAPVDRRQAAWADAAYVKYSGRPDGLRHNGANGIVMRSKSEVLISYALSRHNLAFRYECELRCGTFVVYPDFTILHPKTGEIYYWEHFGMMDDEGYARKAAEKIYGYSAHGIVPGERLIMTFESSQVSLDMELVERWIEYYFL